MTSSRRSSSVDSVDVLARAPRWALDAGLSAPLPEETLRSYCARLGVDYDDLTEGIYDPRALDVANLRLGHLLRLRCPGVWQQEVRSLSD